MPFEIVRNDIVNMQVDAIVNTANPQPEIGYGVDSGIHQKAGPRLLAARKRIGKLPVGSAAITSGYDLDARYVVHTVCPVWRGGDHGEAALLRKCYLQSMELARRRLCRSIAFPLMSAGNHGFPKDLALEIAVEAIGDFLKKHEMQIYLVVFSRSAWQLSEKRFRDISSFIDERYVQEKNFAQYGAEDKCALRELEQEIFLQEQRNIRRMEAAAAEEEPRKAFDEDFDLDAPFFDGELSAEEDASEDPFVLPEPEEGFPLPGMAESDQMWEALPPSYVEPSPYMPEPCQEWGEPAPSMGESCQTWAEPEPLWEDPEPVWEDSASGSDFPRHRPMAKESAPKPASKFAPFAQSDTKNLTDMLQRMDAGFAETLFRLIDDTGKKDSEIYKKANIDRKLFSKIRKNKNYQPSKPTAVAFAIALELDLKETQDLLSRAGFALSHSSKFDIIIEYFIVNRNYNIHEINMTLFEFDQSLLGA